MPAAIEAALEHYRASLDSASIALTEAVHRERTPLTPDPVLEGARAQSSRTAWSASSAASSRR